MFDEMTFKASVTAAEEQHIIRCLSMAQCSRGEIVFWQTTEQGRFRDIHAIMRDSKLNMRFSCHKLWSLWSNGKLDNSGIFCMSDAVATIGTVLSILGLTPGRVRCTRFEVGISMPLGRPPIECIALMRAVGEAGKEVFVDALWQKNRQKTTIKTQSMKKVLKIYDKTFEAQDKGREVAPDILRIETIWKRQSVLLTQLLHPANLARLEQNFWRDWSAPVFARAIEADKGCKASQIEKATAIMTEGLQPYYERMRGLYLERRLSKKSWETVRLFCQRWETEHSRHYHRVASDIERGYILAMKENYDKAVK